MNARTISQRIQPIWRSSRGLPLRTPHLQRRMASSEQHQSSAVGEFYKTFTRPVTKVLLMAIFTYQLAYWGWVKLETDEIKDQRDGEINTLEQKVASLTENLQSLKSEETAAAAQGQIASGDKKKSSWWPW